MVERAIPSIWDLATPEAALAARLDGLGRRPRATARWRRASRRRPTLLREVAAGAPTSGRALGAANAALPWPDEPLAVLWQAATMLRELRGDGHVVGPARGRPRRPGHDGAALRPRHDPRRPPAGPRLDRRGVGRRRGPRSSSAACSATDGRITADGSRGDGGGRGDHRPAGPGAVGRGRPRPDRAVRRAGDAADAGRPRGAARRHAARAAQAGGARPSAAGRRGRTTPRTPRPGRAGRPAPAGPAARGVPASRPGP